MSARIFLPWRIENVGNGTVVPPNTRSVRAGNFCTWVHALHGMRVPSPSVRPSLSMTLGQLRRASTIKIGTMPAVIVYASLRMGTSILTAAALSFIGLGAQPPSPEWGAMLSDGRSYLGVADHITIFPGLAILITVLAFNLLGDGLRDALDQKLR